LKRSCGLGAAQSGVAASAAPTIARRVIGIEFMRGGSAGGAAHDKTEICKESSCSEEKEAKRLFSVVPDLARQVLRLRKLASAFPRTNRKSLFASFSSEKEDSFLMVVP